MSNVGNALARQRDIENAKELERRRLVDEANARTMTAVRLKQEIRESNEALKKRKAAVAAAESILETKHALKSYSIEDLGKGRSRGGGAQERKNLCWSWWTFANFTASPSTRPLCVSTAAQPPRKIPFQLPWAPTACCTMSSNRSDACS